MIVALNNKCNLNKEDFESYIDELTNIKTNHQMILCPTYLHIGAASSKVAGKIDLGVQNVRKI